MKNPFNKYYLCNFNDAVKIEDLPNDELRLLWKCEWSTDSVETIIKSWLSRGSKSIKDEEDVKQIFVHCIELTLIFVQNNFTGPFSHLAELTKMIATNVKLKDYNAFDKLMVNGEEINPNVKLGEMLVIAKEMLAELLKNSPESLWLQWWRLRQICVQQQVVDELTNDLYEEFKSLAENLLNNCKDSFDEMEVVALLFLEIANGFLLFHRSQKSDEVLEALCKHLNVSLNVEGLLGVRTKFQQKPLPQLCLKVVQSSTNTLPSSESTNGFTNMPKLLLLDDDTRLERIRFIEPKDNEVMALPSVLQALVLAKVKQIKRSQPKDRLADEELEPYIQTLLYQNHGPLQVRQATLLLNCVQESNQRRTVERSWKQCEEAVKLLSDTKYSLATRFSYGFCGFLQPKWQVQLQLCELLLSLGMTKTALDIYLEIQAWEQVIECYTRLELRHKAAEVIRQEMAKKPTVLLHCLLGDAIDDPNCYSVAWEFSKHTSGKAQAHWGNYYFRRQEYDAAVSHLQKSVEINALQEKIWLRLGYAAIMLERWELAVHAYITYTHLEPLGFESWNNLAKALIKLGDKNRAHKVLSESLKCNYSNWKVWENFMLVSVDTGNFEDAINAYNRLSELKERYLDLEVLCITINAIAQGKPDAKGLSAERLRKKAAILMGHQCIRYGSEPKMWELAALVAKSPLDKSQKLTKAIRFNTSKEQEWYTRQPLALKFLLLCRELCTSSLEAITNHTADESEAMITSQLSSARLLAQACVRTAEKETEKWNENEAVLEKIKQALEKIAEHLKLRIAAS